MSEASNSTEQTQSIAHNVQHFLECGLDPRSADPRLLRQVRVLNSLMLTAMLLCIPLGIFWTLIITPMFALVYTMSFSAWAAILFWLHKTLQTVAVGRAACFVLFGVCTASAILLGPLGSPILAWFLLMPLAAAVCVGRNDVWFWGVVASLMPSVINWLPELGILEPSPLGSSLEREFSVIVLAAGALVASVLTSYWISHHEKLATRLDDSVAQLKKEALAHRLLVDTAMLASAETLLVGGARKLIEHLENLHWVSSVGFWDARERGRIEKPVCALPSTASFKSNTSLVRAMRTGQRSITNESGATHQSVYYPVRDRQRIVGVLEVNTSTKEDPIHEGNWLLQQVAIQLGHIAERERTAEHIQREARYDSLTKLLNRRAFNDILKSEIRKAKEADRKLALLFIDLNGFKRINDSLGHAAGDKVLKVIAKRLTRTVRESDMLGSHRMGSVHSISRVGGDEFTLVLDNIQSAADANIAATRILNGVTSPVRVNGQQFNVGASVGIAIFPDDAQHVDALIKAADTAMYTSKRRSRSGISRFNASDKSVDSLKFELEIRQALVKNQLEMHYQPVFNAKSSKVVGVEALIRWQHPEHGWIPPGQFIPLAEETGLISEIGQFQFESILRWFESAQQNLPRDFRVAFNLSPTQIEDLGFVSWLVDRLRGSTLPMDQLELEITETALLADTPEARDNLNAIAELGLCITLDDFGTGQSSLSLLKRFPIGRLKIDRSFVSGLPDRSEDVAIVGAVLSLAQSLDIPVVAEGVENEAQRSFLLNRECEDLQGFLMARPMPADQLVEKFGHIWSPPAGNSCDRKQNLKASDCTLRAEGAG